MKKKLVLSAALIFFLIILTSCKEQTLNNWPNEESIQTTPDSSSNDTLTVVYPILGNYPDDMDIIEAAVNDYALDMLNVSVTLHPINMANYNEKTRLMLASKEKVDLLLTGTIGNLDYAGQVVNDQLLNLTPLLNTGGQSIINSLGQFLNSTKMEGNIYAVPTLRDEAKAAGFAIRKDLVKKYQIDLSKVKTLQDIEPILKIIKDNEPNLDPFMQSQESKNGIDGAMKIPGGDPLGSDYYFSGVLMNAKDSHLNVVNYYETPEYEELIKLMRKWNQAGYIYSDVITKDENACSLVKSGKLASFLHDVKPGIEGQLSRQCAREMEVIPIAPVISNSSAVTGIMWSIPSHSKMPEQAMGFLNLMYEDPKLVNLFSWGIEGEHYVIQEDGTINYPIGIDANNTGYGLNEGFIFGNQMLSYVWEGDPINLWDQMDEFNKNAIKSEALGFIFDTSPVKTEYNACLNVWKQYQRALGVGSVDPEVVLHMFINDLKMAGVDKVIAEKQRQLDEWAQLK
jgi:putative aldouronate transport system substrate-binding protein